MHSDILKRIVRAIADGSQPDLEKLARKIVSEERRIGHEKLAAQLEMILSKPRLVRSNGLDVKERAQQTGSTLSTLPTNKRYGEDLVTVIPRDELEHHMVLPQQVEDRFVQIEKEFAARERLAAHGLMPKKTILLHGPSGCGKSLGAKRLAWNLGLPLIKVRFDALLSSFFGESSSNLRTVFKTAEHTPCVLLLDECDFIARARSSSKDIGEANRIVNSLLIMMEEYQSPGLLVATTNIEDALDPALFRRFDAVFQLPLPGIKEIEKLLRTTLSSVSVGALDWKELSFQLDGQSAAVVVKAAQDAAKTVILQGAKAVTQTHLKNAINEVKKVSHN